MTIARGVVALALALPMVAGCARGEAAPGEGAHAIPAAAHRDTARVPFTVAPRTSRDAPTARRFGTRTLPIALRTRFPDLSQYPCTGCHLHRKLTLAAQRTPDAHRNIQPMHPPEGRPGCGGCHAAEDVEQLALASGERVSLDDAYRLCAQCHSQQVNAWSGGAHGKRLDRWAGARVVMGCAECHDPHQPATEARTPFRAPRIHRVGREP